MVDKPQPDTLTWPQVISIKSITEQVETLDECILDLQSVGDDLYNRKLSGKSKACTDALFEIEKKLDSCLTFSMTVQEFIKRWKEVPNGKTDI